MYQLSFSCFEYPKPFILTQQQVIAKAYRMMVKGYSLEAIALEINCDKRTITNYLEVN